jgi:sulfite reductase alpha subunit-like flavoprotein
MKCESFSLILTISTYRQVHTGACQIFQPGAFDIWTAFSREDAQKKVYVQDLFEQHASELRRLILEQEAPVYVCGDASRMAKDVFKS